MLRPRGAEPSGAQSAQRAWHRAYFWPSICCLYIVKRRYISAMSSGVMVAGSASLGAVSCGASSFLMSS